MELTGSTTRLREGYGVPGIERIIDAIATTKGRSKSPLVLARLNEIVYRVVTRIRASCERL